jgi:trehalose 2-sulfotransferase
MFGGMIVSILYWETRICVVRPPEKAYLVCATPRSGSTLLCELLGATDVAGHPLEHFEVLRHSGVPRQPREYFEGVHDFRVLDRLASLRPAQPNRDRESPSEWWARILADGTTPNGVWGGKLMWGHVDDLVARAGELLGDAATDLDAALTRLLGDVDLVHVTRPDKVTQAVSLWRAVQTESWRAGARPSTECATYVFEGIDHLRRQLEEHEAAWHRFFARHGCPVYEVSYDDLSRDPRGIVTEVLHALDLPPTAVPDTAMRRQGDARSAEWAERYRAEAGVRA